MQTRYPALVAPALPDGVGLHWTTLCATWQKLLRTEPRNVTKSLRPPNSQIPVLSVTYGMFMKFMKGQPWIGLGSDLSRHGHRTSGGVLWSETN